MRTPLVPRLDRTSISAAAYRAAFTGDLPEVIEAATAEARLLDGVADDDWAGAVAAEVRALAVVSAMREAASSPT